MSEPAEKDQCLVTVEWDRPSSDTPVPPSLVGPFRTPEDALEWGYQNIPNGAWNVAPLARPWRTTSADKDLAPGPSECAHQWLDRPESDSRECLICGAEVSG